MASPFLTSFALRSLISACSTQPSVFASTTLSAFRAQCSYRPINVVSPDGPLVSTNGLRATDSTVKSAFGIEAFSFTFTVG
jgi:hypothetical protein